MRVQKAENVNKALEFITSRGVKLTNIGPEGALNLASVLIPTRTSLFIRYYRRKPQTHSWNDLDINSTIYDRGHQVLLALKPLTLPLATLTLLLKRRRTIR
jgi:hypothetical protein